MAFTQPDYRTLFEEQCLKNKILQCRNDQLQETILDRFAMAALTGMLSHGKSHGAGIYATEAYGIALAMIKAKEAI